MKHFIHKVTMHYGGKAASASITPNKVVNSDEELEQLRKEYMQTYHASSITFMKSSFDGTSLPNRLTNLKTFY